MGEDRDRLLILAHGGTWDRRFQISSLAASEAAAGKGVDIALFFGALRAWVADEWDALDPASPVTESRLESLALPPLTSMLEPARSTGRLRLYACSASLRILELDAGEAQSRVDAILGWQSFSRMIDRARQVVTL